MKNNRIISFILCLTFIFSCFSTYSIVIADPSEAPLTDPSVIDNNQSAEEVEFDIYPSITEEITIPDEDIPEVIPVENIISKGHSKRLREEEKDLNTIVFENKHGTTTTYVYAKPVKYIENGKIKDKSSKITMVISDEDAYSMKDNSVKITFAKKASNGVRIEYNDYKITFAPTTDSKASPIFNEELNTVTYESVFGDKTSVVYKTNLNGVKEDIVLYEDIGVYSFSFEYHTQKLTAYKEADTWYFVNENNEKVASLGSIIIKDSNGNQTFGEISVKELNKNKYTVTINVPKEFMQSDDTVYPVYVDPAIIMEPQVNDTIIDVGVYSNSTGAYYANSYNDYHYLGYNANSISMATGIVVYKLPDFYEQSGEFVTYSANKIINVTMHIPFAESSSIGTVQMFPMNNTWNSSYGTPYAINSAELLDQKDLDYPILGLETDSTEVYKKISFNITPIVHKWFDDTNVNPNYGIAMVLNDTTTYKRVFSLESNFGVYYEVEAVPSNQNNIYYKAGNISNGYCLSHVSKNFLSCSGGSIYMQAITDIIMFEYTNNYEYIIRFGDNGQTGNNSKVMYCNGSIINATTMSNLTHPKYKWRILFNNGLYAFINVYTGNIINVSPSENFGGEISLVFDYTESTYFEFYDDSYVKLNFILSETTTYWMNNTNGSTLSILLYNSPTSFNNNTAEYYSICEYSFNNYNNGSYSKLATVEFVNSSRLRITAKGENGYLLLRLRHIPTNKKITLIVIIGQLIEDGTYYIKNPQTSMYMQSEGSTYVEQNNYTGAAIQEWYFTYIGNGKYYILNDSTYKFLSLNNSKTSVTQTEDDNITEWFISVSENGNLMFTTMNGLYVDTKSISIPSSNTSSGSNLVYNAMSTSNKLDEWLIETITNHDVVFLGILDKNPRGDYFENALSELSSAGYTSNNFAKAAFFGVDFILNYMSRSKIFMIRTHGLDDSIKTSTSGIISTSTLDNVSLSNVDLVIYGACYTGKGGLEANNLVTATHNRGARTVIGFQPSVNTALCEIWYDLFFQKYSEEMQKTGTRMTYSDICDWVVEEMKESKPDEATDDTPFIIKEYNDYYFTIKQIKIFEQYTIAGQNTLPTN